MECPHSIQDVGTIKMNERIRKLALTNGIYDSICDPYDQFKTGDHYGSVMYDLERFTKLIVEETLKQVDERTYCRGETSWYNDDKDWVRLHFGYGRLAK